MRATTGVGLALWLASGAVAGTATKKADGKADGLAILKKAEQAVKKVERVRYRGEYKATGWVAAFVPTVRGTAVLGPPSKWSLERFRCEVKLQPSGSSETLDLTAGSDGELFFLIDPKVKTAYEDIDPAVLGSNGGDVQVLLMKEFVSPKPFEDELESESIELAETEVIGGEACHQIRIKGESPSEIVWFISKKDFLPRRVRRIYANRQNRDGEKGVTELTLRDLVVNPKFEKDPFKLIVPKGFKKTDEFAP